MSSVDPKPTYTRTAHIYCAALSLGCRNKKKRDAFLSRFGISASATEYLDTRDQLETRRMYDPLDNVSLLDSSVDAPSIMAAAAGASEAARDVRDPDTSGVFIEAMMRFTEDCNEICMDSAAAYRMLDDIVWANGSPNDTWPQDMLNGFHYARGLTTASTCTMKVNAAASRSLADKMYTGVKKNCALEAVRRKIAEDISFHTASRRARLAFSAAWSRPQSKIRKRIYEDGPNVDEVLYKCGGAIRERESCAAGIEYLFLGRVRLIKNEGVAYILDTDNVKKVYQVAHRAYMAAVASACEAEVMPAGSSAPVRVVRDLCRLLVAGAAESARSGLPLAGAARAMHQVWCAEFSRAYESDAPEEQRAAWEDKYSAIMKSARDAHRYATLFAATVEGCAQAVRLDALRLHHIMAAPDTPPELLAKLTFGAKEKVIKPSAVAWSDFMDFAKTYELCMYLYKRKKWPNVEGDVTEKKDSAYARCLRGKFSMPSQNKFGKLKIFQAFPYIKYANQLALRAKDATRITQDLGAALSPVHNGEPYEHNELLHSIRKGNNLGAPSHMDIDTGRDAFWSKKLTTHWVLDTAAKAEATKSDIKPRGTFSAPGEFRHFQAEFDRNCQIFNDFLGCGSIRADPVNHAKGMAKVALGTARGHFCSSHDIEAWSQSQDRKTWCEFGAYRADAFVGIDGSAWAHQWSCFDTVVNKNGFISSAHMDNSGFQGFPGTLDTSLHVLILCFFLYRMRQCGKIPRGQTALAKATIDDCLAQMEDWVGTQTELEEEISSHYMRLGYKIDTVKSVVSRCKAIYLNAAYVRGAHVSQGLKVFCKTDRPMESVLKTPIDDSAGVFGGCKAAIEQGMHPVCAYFAGAALACTYLAKGSTHFSKLSLDTVTMLLLLPRGDGGLGLPTMGDLMTKEHPDARAMSNYAISQWARARAELSHPIDSSSVSLWVHHKLMPYAVVSKQSIFFNPRAVKRADIPEIEGLRRQAIISAAREWDTSEPYTSVLRGSQSEVLSGVYAALLNYAHNGVDCAFLEAYSSHLPERILDALVGKVTSFRVAKVLLGDKKTASVQVAMNGRYDHLIHLASVVQGLSDHDIHKARDAIERVSGYERAQTEREGFLATNNVILLNHTVASPFETIAVTGMHAGNETLPHIGSNFGSMRTAFPDMPNSSRSALSRNGLFYPFKSQNWVADNADEFRYLDQPSHAFVEGCAVIEWARAKGLDVDSWEFVYLARWLGTTEVSTSEYVTHAMQGSIKRSAAAAGDRYHPIFGCRNFIRSSDVNVTPLLTILSEKSNVHDPMGIIASAYAIAGLNMAVIIDSFTRLSLPLQDFTWSIGLHSACLEEMSPVEVKSHVPMEYLRGVFEFELADLSFVKYGGGTEIMLKKITKRGALAALLTGVTGGLGEDDAGIMGEEAEPIAVAPMFADPSSAPDTAMFIVPPASMRPMNLLVNDQFFTSEKVRLLEVSPSAPRLCVVAALQSAADDIGMRVLASLLIEEEPTLTDAQIKGHAIGVAQNALLILKGNVPSQLPMVSLAHGIRAAGCASFRWDDPSATNEGAFCASFGRYAVQNPREFIEALRRTCKDLMSMHHSDYTSSPVAVSISKDPAAANRRERVIRIKKKFVARAALFKARIGAAKGRSTRISRDLVEGRDDQLAKLAYLAGVLNILTCLSFSDGPEVDWEQTAKQLYGRIKTKLESHGAVPRVGADRLLNHEGELDSNGIIDANYGIHARWWKPAHWTRGVMAGAEWAKTDCLHEAKEVYYVPANVRIEVRVRREQIFGSASPRTGIARSPAIPGSVASASTPSMPRSKSRTQSLSANSTSSSSSFNPLAARKAAMKRQVRSKDDCTAWVNSLSIGQVCAMVADEEVTIPASGSKMERQAVVMLRHNATAAHISDDFLEEMKSLLTDAVHSRSLPFNVPVEATFAHDETLVV
jgi:hypothetical protein